MPESNMFDALERDELEAENADYEQALLDAFLSEIESLADPSADLSVEVVPLDTFVVVGSLPSTVEVRSLRAQNAESIGVSDDDPTSFTLAPRADVVIDVDGEDDE